MVIKQSYVRQIDTVVQEDQLYFVVIYKIKSVRISGKDNPQSDLPETPSFENYTHFSQQFCRKYSNR